MIEELNKKKKDRYLFLQSIYNFSDGDTDAAYDMFKLGKELNLNREETQKVVDYLIGEGLIKSIAIGGAIVMTHGGLKEVEQAMEAPDKPTQHFLPLNIINVGSMNHSNILQSTNNSQINIQFDSAKTNELGEILEKLKSICNTLQISPESQKELISEIETLESQKKSPRPKSIIVSESLRSIRTILESVASNAITPSIIELVTKFLFYS